MALAFGSLGLLVGNIIGLSGNSLGISFVAALFALGGGSLIPFLNKLIPNDREIAAISLIALSLSCLLGIYVGILQNEYQIFTPSKTHGSDHNDQTRYLRGEDMDVINSIDRKYTSKLITAEDAYEQLYKAVVSDQ